MFMKDITISVSDTSIPYQIEALVSCCLNSHDGSEARRLVNEGCTVVVAKQRLQLIGCVIINRWNKRFVGDELCFLCVDQRYRRQGIAKLLIQKAVEFCDSETIFAGAMKSIRSGFTCHAHKALTACGFEVAQKDVINWKVGLSCSIDIAMTCRRKCDNITECCCGEDLYTLTNPKYSTEKTDSHVYASTYSEARMEVLRSVYPESVLKDFDMANQYTKLCVCNPTDINKAFCFVHKNVIHFPYVGSLKCSEHQLCKLFCEAKKACDAETITLELPANTKEEYLKFVRNVATEFGFYQIRTGDVYGYAYNPMRVLSNQAETSYTTSGVVCTNVYEELENTYGTEVADGYLKNRKSLACVFVQEDGELQEFCTVHDSTIDNIVLRSSSSTLLYNALSLCTKRNVKLLVHNTVNPKSYNKIVKVAMEFGFVETQAKGVLTCMKPADPNMTEIFSEATYTVTPVTDNPVLMQRITASYGKKWAVGIKKLPKTSLYMVVSENDNDICSCIIAGENVILPWITTQVRTAEALKLLIDSLRKYKDADCFSVTFPYIIEPEFLNVITSIFVGCGFDTVDADPYRFIWSSEG